VAGTAKSTINPAHMNRSLIGSYCSDQAITHPLKKRGNVRFGKGSTDPTSNHPTRAVLPNWQAGYASTGTPSPMQTPADWGMEEFLRGFWATRTKGKSEYHTNQPKFGIYWHSQVLSRPIIPVVQHMNRVNSCNGWTVMTAPSHCHFYYYYHYYTPICITNGSASHYSAETKQVTQLTAC